MFRLGKLIKSVLSPFHYFLPKEKTKAEIVEQKPLQISHLPPSEQVLAVKEALLSRLTSTALPRTNNQISSSLDKITDWVEKKQFMQAQIEARKILVSLEYYLDAEVRSMVKEVVKIINSMSSPLQLQDGEAREIIYNNPVQIGPCLWITSIKDLYSDLDYVKGNIFYNMTKRKLSANWGDRLIIVDSNLYNENPISPIGKKNLAVGEFIYIGQDYMFAGKLNPKNLQPGGLTGDLVPPKEKRVSKESCGEGNLAIIGSKGKFYVYKPKLLPQGERKSKTYREGVAEDVIKIEFIPFADKDKERILGEMADKITSFLNLKFI